MKKFLKIDLSMNRFFFIGFLTVQLILSQNAFGQGGKVLHLTIHAASLEENLIKESPQLSLGIYLPPGYEKQPKKRYPVVYWLHGYSGWKNTTGMTDWGDREAEVTINKLIESGAVEPMIIVMPDGSNRFGGSFYTNSYTTGNWEDFIAHELPEYIDSNYRSIPKPESRGIAGHSMGGYGALKIAMKHPDIFSSVYGHCSCCLTLSPSYWDENAINQAMSIDNWDAMLKGSWWVKALHAFSAATSSNPNNPPFYSDLPYEIKGDSILINENTKAKWAANIPSWMADQYISNLRKLRAIALDAATRDSWTTGSEYFANALNRINVKNNFEIYKGGHNDMLSERFYNNILPFFSKMLITEGL